MKVITPFFFLPLFQAEDYDSSLCELSNEEEDCGGFKNLAKTRKMIEDIICPDGKNSQNPACAGRTNDKGTYRSFMYDLKRAIKNYGCNCYNENKRQVNEDGGRTFYPKSNGQPIDQLDQACYALNQHYKCFVLDQNNFELESSCDYRSNYRWHIDNGEVVCGTKNDPNYSNSGDFCRLALCEMEKEFAYKVAPILADPRSFKVNNNNNYGLWSTNKCVHTQSDLIKDHCCGYDYYGYSILTRQPYDPNAQCCGDDGSLSPIELCV